MSKPKKPVQSSRMDALKLEDVELILKTLSVLEPEKRFLFICLLYGGYRIGELRHQQPDWIHIGDEYAKNIGVDYIQIPQKGEFCTCTDCKLQVFLEQESNKEGVIYTDAWRRQIRKKFNPDEISGRYWKPKTFDGSRKLPILYDSFRDELTEFYAKNRRLDYTRQWAWGKIKEISMDVWGYKEVPSKGKKGGVYRVPVRALYPHALRATAASLWAMRGLNATALMKVMGWSSIEIADMYVKSDEKQALLTCKSLIVED